MFLRFAVLSLATARTKQRIFHHGVNENVTDKAFS